jgi:hypothetical protein
MSDLALLLAIEGVRRTLARYNIAGDRGHSEELSSTFQASGVLETPERKLFGRLAITKELIRLQTRMDPRLTRVRHHLTTSLIDIELPDLARAKSYFLVTTDIGIDHTGVYNDTLRLQAGEWLFETRKVRLDFVAKETLFGFEPAKPHANQVAQRASI